MGRPTVALVLTVLVGPIIVGLFVNLASPWLLANAGMVGQILTSPWLPWGVYGLWAAGWLYYWFVVVAQRDAPTARMQRLNRLFTEQEAIRAAVTPAKDAVIPGDIGRRVERFRTDVGNLLASDIAYRDWLFVYHQYDVIRKQPDAGDPERRTWRAAVLLLMAHSDAILQEFRGRVSPIGPQSPPASRRDR